MAPPEESSPVKSVLVEAPGRIHLGLLQMSSEYERMNMGVGAAVDSPAWRVELRRAKECTLVGNRRLVSRDMLEEGGKYLGRLAIALNSGPLAGEIIESIPLHVGLGSRTALYSGLLAGACRLKDRRLDWKRLRSLTGRGGTSGIGVNAAVRGGVLLDFGHMRQHTLEPFLPSGSRPGKALPLCLRFSVPSWRVILARPAGVVGLHGHAEREFFLRSLPVPPGDSSAIATIVLYGVLPALAERNLAAFSKAICALQEVGFKRREWEVQHASVVRMADHLKRLGAEAVALSSLGPTLVVFARDPDQVWRELSRDYGTDVQGRVVRVLNRGVVVRDI